MKVAVVTWYNSYNFGTCLQAYALCKYLGECGHDVSMVNMTYYVDSREIQDLRWLFKKTVVRGKGKIKSVISKKAGKDDILIMSSSLFDRFIVKGFNAVRVKNQQDINNLNREVQAFVTGSDQIWNPALIKSCYLLKFADHNAKKIAYSSSFGVKSIPKAQRRFYAKYLSRFHKIYVREKTGVNIIRDQLKCAVPTDYVLDPTLLPTAEQWTKWMSGNTLSSSVEQIINEGNYFVYYFVGKRSSYSELVAYIARRTGLKPVAIPYHEGKLLLSEIREATGPSEFVELIRNASLVCTDSFHATCFALNFIRPMFVIKRFDDQDARSQNSRLEDLMKLFGLSSRLINDQFEEHINLDYTFSAEEIHRIRCTLDEERHRSQQLLKNAILE